MILERAPVQILFPVCECQNRQDHSNVLRHERVAFVHSKRDFCFKRIAEFRENRSRIDDVVRLKFVQAAGSGTHDFVVNLRQAQFHVFETSVISSHLKIVAAITNQQIELQIFVLLRIALGFDFLDALRFLLWKHSFRVHVALEDFEESCLGAEPEQLLDVAVMQRQNVHCDFCALAKLAKQIILDQSLADDRGIHSRCYPCLVLAAADESQEFEYVATTRRIVYRLNPSVETFQAVGLLLRCRSQWGLRDKGDEKMAERDNRHYAMAST